MADIKTRILLRNDTLANWNESNSVTLKKGEIGIAMLDGNLAEVRVGNNTNWAASKKLRIEADQISGLTEQISAIAHEYQITAGTGDDLNKWFLQSRPLSGGDWATVSIIDLAELTGYALSTDVDALVAAVSAATYTSAVGDANSYTDEHIDALSVDRFMESATFNAISNEIGLSAASSSNPVVTKNGIADLAGAMHFRGAVTPTESQSDRDAIAAYYEAKELTPEAGDIVIITTNSKEYVYSGSAWVELGDEVLYATKAEVATDLNAVSVALSNDYVGKIGDLSTNLETLVGTVSAETLVSANAYTNEQIAALSIGNYALSADVDALVAAVSAETYESAVTSANSYTDEKIAALNIDDYALSADVDSLVAAVSAETLTSANSYTDESIEGISATISTDYIRNGEVTSDDLSGYFVLDCGGASYREGEQAATEA